MFYGRIKTFDVANGEGIRVSLFVSGCRNHCKNCFNKETWDFSFGKEFAQETMDYIVEKLQPTKVKGLSILGGEPLEPENQETILGVLKALKTKCPDKSIWMYTGFTWEELHSPTCRANTSYLDTLLSHVDVLVDGRFVEEEKDFRLRFRGSRNQRIINCKESLKKSEVIVYELEDK